MAGLKTFAIGLNMKTRLLSPSTAIRCLFVAGLLAALSPAAGAKEGTGPPKVNVSDRDIDRSVRGASYASVIKRVTPSVVTIYSTRTVKVQPFWGPFLEDPMFRRFFGDQFGQGGRPSTRNIPSLGSGVIVSEDGYILTNNHVVEGADKDGVKIALGDGKTEYDAKVVGNDPRTDVAVLKIEAKNLKAITLADSDKLEVGDVVLAIGNPFNVGQSVTMGIVSALGRGDLPTGRMAVYEDFIQTDAAINPGNSGGALVDAEGRLVGINQSIIGAAGANAGVGFAIPINLARNALSQLATDGKIARGYLGILPQDLDRGLARQFGAPDQNGALVSDVMPGTPAEKAGIKQGDVIVEINGKKINDRRHLQLTVSQLAPGTKVNVKALRRGTEKSFMLTLGELPEEGLSQSSGTPSNTREPEIDALDGVEVTDLDSRTRRELNIPRNVQGALVAKVDPDSNAAAARLREGDVITEINRQPVRDADEAVNLTRKVKDDEILLRVWSGANGIGGSRYVSVDTKKK